MRFNVPYTVALQSVPVPQNFVLEDLVLLKRFLFSHILELKDWRIKAETLIADDKICDSLHFMPVFGRTVDGAVEVAPMSSVLDHLVHEFRPMFSEDDSEWLKTTSQSRLVLPVIFRGKLSKITQHCARSHFLVFLIFLPFFPCISAN